MNIWNVRAGTIVRSFRANRQISDFALDEERGFLVGVSPQQNGRFSVSLFEFATGRPVRQIGEGEPFFGINGVLVAQGGLLTSHTERGTPLESILWSFETGRQLAEFPRPAEAIAADGCTVLGGPVIWELPSGRTRGQLRLGSQVWGRAISADGRRAVSETSRAGILWNDEGEVLRTLADQPTPIARAAFSPDGRFLITARYPETFRGDGRLLVLRDGRDGRLLADLPGHERSVRGIAFSPDGSSALSAGLNGELILWSLPPDLYR